MTTVRVPVGFWGEMADGRKRDTWERNARNAREAGREPCTRCGKGIVPGSGFVVEIVGGGARFAANDEFVDEYDGGYMGCWVIGPECGRKIPATHKVKYEGWNNDR